jgi:hypothetical protein
VIILKIPTADGDLFEEVSRISDLGEEGERITAINYFGPIAYAGKLPSRSVLAISLATCAAAPFLVTHPVLFRQSHSCKRIHSMSSI